MFVLENKISPAKSGTDFYVHTLWLKTQSPKSKIFFILKEEKLIVEGHKKIECVEFFL